MAAYLLRRLLALAGLLLQRGDKNLSLLLHGIVALNNCSPRFPSSHVLCFASQPRVVTPKVTSGKKHLPPRNGLSHPRLEDEMRREGRRAG